MRNTPCRHFIARSAARSAAIVLPLFNIGELQIPLNNKFRSTGVKHKITSKKYG
jgi:hypothetical protein